MESNRTPQTQACSERAAVLLNGEYTLSPDFFRLNKEYETFDFFCADGGANLAVKLGIVPLMVVGDMDSITIQTRRRLERVCRFVELPADKDVSDAEALLKILEAENYREIHLFAATGGRIDQTLFNLQLLSRFPQARIITLGEEIFHLPKAGCVSGKSGCRASLISLSEQVTGLTLTGFRFNLSNQLIQSGSTLTLSNIIVSDKACISYDNGSLLMVVERLAPASDKPRHGLHLVK
jgi:thiamine pyrophosphokinase